MSSGVHHFCSEISCYSHCCVVANVHHIFFYMLSSPFFIHMLNYYMPRWNLLSIHSTWRSLNFLTLWVDTFEMIWKFFRYLCFQMWLIFHELSRSGNLATHLLGFLLRFHIPFTFSTFLNHFYLYDLIWIFSIELSASLLICLLPTPVYFQPSMSN